MASKSLATTTVPVPRAMLEAHPNSIAMPIEKDFAIGRHTYRRDEWVLVDMDAHPEHGDLVVIFRPDAAPFARLCWIAPMEGQPRNDMVMGALDPNGEDVQMVKLGGNGRQFGVVVGLIPPKPMRTAERAEAHV